MPPLITSTGNQHVQYCRGLQRPAVRRDARAFLVEGLRLAEDALDNGAEPSLILFDRTALESSQRGSAILGRIRDLPATFEASAKVISAAAATKTPAGLVMVIPEPDPAPLESIATESLLLILDGIADAGNAGTILRTAAAADVRRVVFAGETVDPFGAKTVRSAMGAHFRLSVLRVRWPELEPVLRGFDQVVGLSAEAGTSIYELGWQARTALVVGSEAHGLGGAALGSLTSVARIPMAAGVESLNAASVAAITLFEARRSCVARLRVELDK